MKVKVNQNVKFKLSRSKVKVKVKQKVKFTSLTITLHLIVTETSNLVHILVYEKPHQIWPRPLTFDLDLEKSAQGQYVWNISIKENCQTRRWKPTNVKGQCQAKGQIHLIGYNFASNCHRDFKLGSYFSLWKAAPNMTLTLTLKCLPKVKFFEPYKLGKTVKGEGESQPKCQIH